MDDVTSKPISANRQLLHLYFIRPPLCLQDSQTRRNFTFSEILLKNSSPSVSPLLRISVLCILCAHRLLTRRFKSNLYSQYIHASDFILSFEFVLQNSFWCYLSAIYFSPGGSTYRVVEIPKRIGRIGSIPLGTFHVP